MNNQDLIFSLFVIFTGAAIFSTLALFTRQSLIVAYMILGMLIGPSGLKLITDPSTIHVIGDVGIIFLLFLLGLDLSPRKLLHMLRQVTWVGVVSSIAFALMGYFLSKFFGFGTLESVIIGSALMFSSTIIGIKLLPTTVLHHQHTGEVMISILLFQDLIAIIVLLILHELSQGGGLVKDALVLFVGFPGVMVFAFLFERYVLAPLFSKFDQVREYLFLVAIGWCLAVAQLAQYLGLSHEIGAFVAGVTIASGPISLFIAESLKPVRDFFLVLFFFTVGAGFDLNFLKVIALPACVLAAAVLVIKPAVYRFLLHQVSESKSISWEIGFRLGQISEFSLIIAFFGSDSSLISSNAAYLIQATAILTFIISSYWVIIHYPTPVALSSNLRRD